MSNPLRVGQHIEVDVGKVGNGGICVARHDGVVVLVRHALPGERVRCEITQVNSSFARADAVDVLAASTHRVTPPCRYAQVCGGCDWQHADVAFQLQLKVAIVAEQLQHATRLTHIRSRPISDLPIERLPGSPDGLRWRTRNRFQRIDDDHLGMFRARSKSIVEIDDCLIALAGAVDTARKALPHVKREVAVVSHPDGRHVVVDARGGPMIQESVGSRQWRIHANSFWQVHRDAAEAFTRKVLQHASPAAGNRVLDLYSGAGLFSAALAQAVGSDGYVVAVESGIDAVRDARRSLSDLGNIDLVTADVLEWLQNDSGSFDVVVLDPPRAGAGRDVIELVARKAQRSIVYVACEPSALARDTALLLDNGWLIDDVDVLDAFPMTAHVEAIASFTRIKP